MYYVYKHTAPNGKVYIGITSLNPMRRWRDGIGYKEQVLFYNAIQKYNWENIKHEILFENLTKEEACQKEIELITKYKSNDPKFGYNLTSGGENCEHCEESRKKMSEIASKRTGKSNGFYGRHHSEETKQKIRDAHKRRKELSI